MARRHHIVWPLLVLALVVGCATPRPRPTPAPPTPGPGEQAPGEATLVTFEVYVHDLATPAIGLQGVTLVCGGQERLTNPDGTAHFDVPAGRQLDCQATREGYDQQTASAVPGIDTRLPIWLHRTFTPAPALQPLRVEPNRRWFGRADGTRFDYREYSAFALLGMLQAGLEDEVRANLRGGRAMGFTVTRVILAYTGVDPRESGPHRPNFFPALARLLAIASDEGVYLRLTYLGGLGAWGATWDPARREDKFSGAYKAGAVQFVHDVTRHICGQPGVLAELVNEPLQTGFRSSFATIVALGREVKALCPSLLLSGGSVDGPNEGDTTFAVEPFDYVDAHLHRLTDVGGFEWVKRSGEQPLIDQEHVGKRMPFLSGEPINFAEGRGGDVEQSPAVAFAYAAVSRARQFNTNFHFDGGLYGRLPAAGAAEHVRCYMAALDAYPMTTDTKWRGHWGLNAGDYWKDVWPNTDGTREVEDHIRRGRGPWRAFGSGPYSVVFPEPAGWNWRANLDAPADRLAECSGNGFSAAVYRRQ